MPTDKNPIPVIDLFAGPGGLGEGFASFRRSRNGRNFRIHLSIEMEKFAHRTLELRSFFRQFPRSRVPAAYYNYLRNIDTPEDVRRTKLFDQFPEKAEHATREAWQAELGVEDPGHVRDRIGNALGKARHWVLLGGPPCQAYSLVGRSRNRGVAGYVPEKDKRQHLYREYLRIISDHRPSVFIMENVKGLLSATLKNEKIFSRIIDDLQEPSKALEISGRPSHRYRLYSVVVGNQPTLFDATDRSDFIVRMEKYGIPQARHRLIILGIRSDLGDCEPAILDEQPPVSARRVLDGLPRLRSGLSKQEDDPSRWCDHLRRYNMKHWTGCTSNGNQVKMLERLSAELNKITRPEKNRGDEFVSCAPGIDYRPDWYLDKKLKGICNHSTRSHIAKDLYRYFFAACFAGVEGRSPALKDFPAELLPKHRNVQRAMDGELFGDRFRVQLSDRPSTTITSHISKDGHYYIHPDPTQCRSLTVREAARLQTFPDNYFFCGPRTAQYVQVGNAVPPLLASQIAKIVHGVLKDAERSDG